MPQKTDTVCLHGHVLARVGTYPVNGTDRVMCRGCQRIHTARYWQKNPRVPAKRKTHCLNGHRYSKANTRVDKRGSRVCRICCSRRNRAATIKYRENMRASYRKEYAKKITDGLPPELAGVRVAILELTRAAQAETARQCGGEVIRKWGQTHCLRGHPYSGKGAKVRYRGKGGRECLLCANILRMNKRKQAEVGT